MLPRMCQRIKSTMSSSIDRLVIYARFIAFIWRWWYGSREGPPHRVACALFRAELDDIGAVVLRAVAGRACAGRAKKIRAGKTGKNKAHRELLHVLTHHRP